VKTVTLVLPTFNEAPNIQRLLSDVQKECSSLDGYLFNFVVVDDYSPDGTAELVKELMAHNDRVHLVQGVKEGLGKAYIRGFRWVLQNLENSDYVIQMDADFSHNPKYIPKFLSAAAEGYDFVIGARYVPGGGCPDWTWQRRMLSFWGNQYIRFVGGMAQVHDCTSGYRCLTAALLRKIDFDQLLTRGYSFQSVMLHQAIYRGAKIKEIPIIFTDRKIGKSKLGKKDVMECLKAATTLRIRQYS
jgi:dolichol-phosphate mannosyltransferase